MDNDSKLDKHFLVDYANNPKQEDFLHCIWVFAHLIDKQEELPQEFMQWLADQFRAYVESDGEKSLDEIFGVGKRYLKKAKYRSRNSYIALCCFQLFQIGVPEQFSTIVYSAVLERLSLEDPSEEFGISCNIDMRTVQQAWLNEKAWLSSLFKDDPPPPKEEVLSLYPQETQQVLKQTIPSAIKK